MFPVVAKSHSEEVPSVFPTQTLSPSLQPTVSPKAKLRRSKNDPTVVPSVEAQQQSVVPDVKPSTFKTPMKVEASVSVNQNATETWSQSLLYAKSLLTEEDLRVPFEFNCTLHFGAKACKKGDPRSKFVYKYRKHNTKEIYLIVINHHWNIFAAIQTANGHKQFDIPGDFDPCKDRLTEIEEENTSRLDDVFFQ